MGGNGPVVYHPGDAGTDMCEAGEPLAPPAGRQDALHGRAVTCRGCGKPGYVPEPGHEIDFCPPGTELAGDGRITVTLSGVPWSDAEWRAWWQRLERDHETGDGGHVRLIAQARPGEA